MIPWCPKRYSFEKLNCITNTASFVIRVGQYFSARDSGGLRFGAQQLGGGAIFQCKGAEGGTKCQ